MMLFDGFIRFNWPNKSALVAFQPILEEANVEEALLEVKTVSAGLREVGTTQVRNESFQTQIMRSDNLHIIVLGHYKVFQGFTHHLEATSADDPNAIAQVAFGRNKDKLEEFRAAWKQNNHAKMGELLGYPSCCVKNFVSLWSKGYHDLALNSVLGEYDDKREYEASAKSIETNTFWRYGGPRLVFHLPCSVYCEESIALGQKFLKLLNDIKPKTKILSVLSQPLKIDAYRGVIIVNAPFVQFYAATDFTKAHLRIHLNAPTSQSARIIHPTFIT